VAAFFCVHTRRRLHTEWVKRRFYPSLTENISEMDFV